MVSWQKAPMKEDETEKPETGKGLRHKSTKADIGSNIKQCYITNPETVALK